jgi:integrase
LCALQVADLDLQRMEVWVRKGKGSKPRTVPIAQEMRQPLLDYLYSRPSHSRHLLLASTSGLNAAGPFTSEGVRMMIKRRCDQAGLPMLSAHKFRHGFAMWLREQGADLSDIAAVMGHTSTQVTQMYYAYTLAPTARKAYDKALEKMRAEHETQ